MAKKTGMRLDLYMREGDTIIVAEPYLNTPFALSWIQAQADNTRRLEDIRHEPPPRETLKVAQP